VPVFRLGSPQRSRAFFFLLAFLVPVFLLGGGSRADIQSLALLRPLAGFAFVLALFSLRRVDVQLYRWPIVVGVAAFVLTGLHLVPLPPALWSTLPGHGLIAQIDEAAGIAVWRPLSISPRQTANAFFALTVPLAVLFIAIRLDREEQQRLLVPILIVGGISAVLGLLQIAGGASSRFYFYDISNFGSAVGLFANRNHQAAFMATLFPMLAVYASRPADTVAQARFRIVLAAVSAAILIPMLLITGSRSGLVLGMLGLVGAALLFKRPKSRTAPRRRGDAKFPVVPAALGIMTLAFVGIVTLLSSRAESVARLMQGDEVAELRVLTLRPILGMIADFLPLGSGVGTFVEAFQRDEPTFMLQPTYFNHAHNDFLEVSLTGGLPALVLIVAGLGWALIAGARAWQAGEADGASRFARLGAVIIAILAAASIVDYPLRTPALSSLLAIAAVWLAGTKRSANADVG
jgi:O-antigen ligase